MNITKILVFTILFLTVAFFVQSKVQPIVQQKISNFILENIALKIPLYSFVKDNLLEGNIIGVITFVTFANIPIIPSPPSEAYIIFAFTKGTNPILIISVVSVITTITSSISYLIGYIFGPKVVEKITKKEFKYSRIMNFLSVPITFLTHLLPLPLPAVFPFIFGAYKSNYRNFVIAAFFGVVVRFSSVIILFNLYGDAIYQLPGLIKSLS